MVEDVRPSSRTSPSTCRKIKYSNHSDTPGSCLTNDHRWSATQTRLLAPHTVIYEQIRSGRLRSVTQGRARFIPAAALNDYVNLLVDESHGHDQPA